MSALAARRADASKQLSREGVFLRSGPRGEPAAPFAPDEAVAAEIGDASFLLGFRGLKHRPWIIDDAKRCCALFGHLIVDDRIVERPDVERIERALADDAALARLNGEFLVIHLDKTRGRVRCAVDRFASVQWHHAMAGPTLIGAFSFTDACDALAAVQPLRWDGASVLEFLKFRRVHADSTLVEQVKFLRAGSILASEGGRAEVRRYFAPSYGRRGGGLRDSGDALAEAISRSVARKTSDGKSCGLFLSGGHDTRLVLAAAEKELSCVTLGFADDTREILRAREMAALKGYPHRTIQLPPDHYERIYEAAVLQNGGQYNVANIFNDLPGFDDRPEIALCGTGVDYMFQGMYMPANRMSLAGRPLAWKTRKPVPDDVSGYYLAAFSSRMRFAGVDDYLASETAGALNETLRARLSALEAEARQLTDDADHVWNHMFLADPSRHYSYPDNLGMRTLVELRTPSFDNDVHDLFLTMPMEHRFDRRAVRAALARLNPSFLKVPSANDDLPIVSSRRKSAHQVGRYLKRRMVGAPPLKPVEAERTWPTNDRLLTQFPSFRERCLGLAASPAAEALPWIDFAKLGGLATEWYAAPNERPRHSADFLWNCIALATFAERYS